MKKICSVVLLVVLMYVVSGGVVFAADGSYNLRDEHVHNNFCSHEIVKPTIVEYLENMKQMENRFISVVTKKHEMDVLFDVYNSLKDINNLFDFEDKNVLDVLDVLDGIHNDMMKNSMERVRELYKKYLEDEKNEKSNLSNINSSSCKQVNKISRPAKGKRLIVVTPIYK